MTVTQELPTKPFITHPSHIHNPIRCWKGSPSVLILFSYSFLDHGIHPPVHKPWEAPHVPNTDHVFKNNHGVYNIYLNEEDLKNNKPCNFEYPDVVAFTTDFYKMCNMIADGPL